MPFKELDGAKSVALIANGSIHNYSQIVSLIQDYDRWIAVDGGLIHCHKMHIRPTLLIGDFDSIPLELLQQYGHCPIYSFPEEKNETDMELAVRAANLHSVQKIGIFGAMEKRTDHALANLHLMRRFPDKVVIETEKETLLVVQGKKQLDCHPGQVVSLIPIGDVASGVTTHGLKWELKNAALDKNFMSVSNICLGSNFTVSVREGDLICCLLRFNGP